jgi:hypothetical protein
MLNRIKIQRSPLSRYRLVSVTLLIFLVISLYSLEPSLRSELFKRPAIAAADLFRDFDESHPSCSVWTYLSQQRTIARPHERRPSWGVLKQQGAKSSFRENLKDDERYFMAFTFAGYVWTLPIYFVC